MSWAVLAEAVRVLHAARQAGTRDLPVDQHSTKHIDFAADIPACS